MYANQPCQMKKIYKRGKLGRLARAYFKSRRWRFRGTVSFIRKHQQYNAWKEVRRAQRARDRIVDQEAAIRQQSRLYWLRRRGLESIYKTNRSNYKTTNTGMRIRQGQLKNPGRKRQISRGRHWSYLPPDSPITFWDILDKPSAYPDEVQRWAYREYTKWVNR